MRLVENLRGYYWALKIAVIVVGIIIPFVHSSTRVAAVFVLFTLAGGLTGWLWGRAEAKPGKVPPTAVRLVSYSFGFFIVHVFLEAGLPHLGVPLPMLFADELFLPLVVVSAFFWGLAIGAFVRLLTILDRSATTAR